MNLYEWYYWPEDGWAAWVIMATSVEEARAKAEAYAVRKGYDLDDWRSILAEEPQVYENGVYTWEIVGP